MARDKPSEIFFSHARFGHAAGECGRQSEAAIDRAGGSQGRRCQEGTRRRFPSISSPWRAFQKLVSRFERVGARASVEAQL